MDLSQFRKEYSDRGLHREDLAADPMVEFEKWFHQAIELKLHEPNAMSLATADASGRPLLRTVLLKYFDTSGFVFFTNYESRKARDIAAQAEVSLLFPWYPLERQVGLLGKAERISAAESLAYFASRPHGSRLGAWVSQQSTVITSRKLLEMKWEEVKRKFSEGAVPLPSFWGGFRVVPVEFEFWQGRENRLHDRFRYVRSGDGWTVERLAP